MATELNPNVGLYDYDMIKIVQELANNSAKVKAVIFKNIIMGSDIDKRSLQQYIGYVNSMLSAFEKYGDVILNNASKYEGSTTGYGISYAGVKDYLYTKYDYASALPFTDGLIKGINEKKITNNEEVLDFFTHTANKAFKNRAFTTAGLVDQVIEDMKDCRGKLNDVELKKFKSVKDQNLFDSMDRVELYKTIQKVIEFLCSELNKNRYIHTRDMKLLVSFVNNIIEYITYSITAYITRIYIITKYLSCFKNPARELIAESVNENISKIARITLINDIDETNVRDMTKIFDYIDNCSKFITTIGGVIPKIADIKELKRSCDCFEELKDNRFNNALLDNSFYEFLSNRIYTLFDEYGMNRNRSLAELNETLKEFLLNNGQALSTRATAKQAMLSIIKELDSDNDNKKDSTDLAADLLGFTSYTLFKIYSITSRIQECRMDNNHVLDIRTLTVMAELIKQLNSVYKEIAIATLFKFRDIEMKINDMNNNESDHVKDLLAIKVPGMKDNDYSSNNVTMAAVPDTTRVPLELMNLYAQPSFEYYQMYDEYASSLLPGDAYYTEAAVWINKIKSWLQAILTAIKRRWNDAKFQAAVKWVGDHKGDLQSMNYTGTMEVLPYGALKIDYIDELIKKLDEINADLLKDKTQFEEFIKSLYVTPELQYIFLSGSVDDKLKNTKYRNYILFGIDPKSTNNDVKGKKLVDSQIKDEMTRVWIPTIVSSTTTSKELIDTSNELNQKIDNFNRVAAQNTSKVNNDIPPAMNNDEQNSSSSAQSSTQPAKEEDKGVNAEEAVTKLQTVFTNLWQNLEPTVYKAINDQYSYIQQAHSLGRK